MVFALDIILRFRTTYIDSVSGEEIVDSYLIGNRYLSSSEFFFDIISTIPFDNLSTILFDDLL